MNRPSNAPDGAAIAALAEQARQLTRAGRAADAAVLWQRILAADPDRTEALLALSIQALAQKDATAALGLLQRAAATAPRDPMVQVYQALAHKELGQPDEEMAAVLRAQAIDPNFYPALLHKGMLLERLGKRRQAARLFKDLLKFMPGADSGGPGIKQAITHAEASILENQLALERHLDGVLAELRSKHAGARLERFEESVQVMTGAKKRYSPEPTTLHFAQLPPLQFYDEELFPWLPELEAAAAEIRRECEAILNEQRNGFSGESDESADDPDRTRDDDPGSLSSPAYFLWKNGERVDAHCERCPRTAAAIGSLPLARARGIYPNVRFSLLEPGAASPPDTGDTNARLVTLLPLLLPSVGGSLRVGNEIRELHSGKACVYDGSVENESRNDGSQARVELVFEIWNPLLSQAEQELVGSLLGGVHDYYLADD